MKDIFTTFAADLNTSGSGTVHVDSVGNDLTGSSSFMDSVTAILNGVIGALGIVCVIVMIIGGVNYMTSSGDAAKVKKGKDTILYGLIGLVICVLAFAIVNFVISNIIGGK
jgi:TRAP-type C4-dicarboxylate transport system permease small subunit